MVFVGEEITSKIGVELFKEVLRVYPVAEVDDYFKGMWRNDLMRLDLQMLYAHMREAGAPYPPPLEHVKLPSMPPGSMVIPQAQPVKTLMVASAKSVGPVLGKAPGTAPAAAPVSSANAPAAELRLIAMFVAKWRLNPSTTKSLLAKLTAQRRRHVIQNFKPTDKEDTEVNDALVAFIDQCEADDSWAVKSPPAAGPRPVTPRPAGMGGVRPAGAMSQGQGVKRPLNPMFNDNNKRPRAMTPQGMAGQGLARPTMGVRPGFRAMNNPRGMTMNTRPAMMARGLQK